MNGLRSAIGFLTILPFAPRDAEGGLASARVWFPVVGLLLGAILAATDLLLRYGYDVVSSDSREFPPLLLAVILTFLLVALTRALHLDGFMDCCDALFGGFDRERRMEILRDPRVGAFAVAGAVGLILLKVGAIMSLPANIRVWAILIFPCLSRGAVVLVMHLFPYVRSGGIGAPFLKRGGRWQTIVALLTTLIIAIGVAGFVGAALVAVVMVVAWAMSAWASRRLGGVTGDVYGAVIEVVETCALLASLFAPHGSIFSMSPPLLRMLE